MDKRRSPWSGRVDGTDRAAVRMIQAAFPGARKCTWEDLDEIEEVLRRVKGRERKRAWEEKQSQKNRT